MFKKVLTVILVMVSLFAPLSRENNNSKRTGNQTLTVKTTSAAPLSYITIK
ncbi:MAG: hypothetical protein IPP49_18600 [Saprospiraceae bacterium]|nr:hypothetical protein [Saprospiraceae bacterium]